MGAKSVRIENGENNGPNYGARVNAAGELLVSAAVTGGTFTANAEKAEDAPHSSGEVGNFVLAVRRDAHSTMVDADGDYAPLQVNSTGQLKVSIHPGPSDIPIDIAAQSLGDVSVDLATVSTNLPVIQATHANLNATVRVQDGNGTGLMDIIQNGDSVLGNHLGPTVMAEVTDSPVAQGGEWDHLRMSEAGGLYVSNIGGTITVVDTLNVTPGTGVTSLGKPADGSFVIGAGHVGVMALSVRRDVAASQVGADGDYTPTIVDSTGRLWCNVSNDVEVVQPTHADLNATIRVKDGNGTNLMDVASAGDTSTPAYGSEVGIIPLAFFDGEATSPNVDAWNGLKMNSKGELLVISNAGNTAITSITPGIASNNLGKREDDAHASQHTGVMALAVRRDSPAVGSGADGDYSTINVDANGRLWVRNDNFDTLALSGSTRGRPIQIAATASTGTTLHTATTTTGELDRVWIWLTNTADAPEEVVIEFGATGTGNQVKFTVPGNDTILAVDGAVIGGAATDTITAFAETTNVVNATGRVERIPA